MRKINFLIATFFGIGRIPVAPGTWASLAAAPCFWPFLHKPLLHAVALVLVYFLGVHASTEYEKQVDKKDPSSAVIDEVLGMGVAMFGIPVMVGVPQWPFVVMAVILFRLFDIWKPYPIRKLEKLPAGWGIMSDDLLAGIYANVWVQIGVYVVNALR
jgi:phosphatidylglycerophosphatase A